MPIWPHKAVSAHPPATIASLVLCGNNMLNIATMYHFVSVYVYMYVRACKTPRLSIAGCENKVFQ